MQRLDLKQLLSQKLSPQQIQFIKLLQIPTAELETRIKEEMEVNPALEEGSDDEMDRNDDNDADSNDDFDADDSLDEDFDNNRNDDDSPGLEEDYRQDNDDIDISDYTHDDEIAGYKMQGDGPSEEEDRDMPLAGTSTLIDSLLDQLNFLNLDEKQHAIGEQLIGSIDNDGYIRRDLSSIANDLAFSQNIEVSIEEIEAVLREVQTFDPPGIAARDLQECLLLQLERREQDEETEIAERIISDCFDEFTKKHYSRIQARLDIEDDELKEALNIILKLNPKPGGFTSGLAKAQYIIPDFIITNDNGILNITLNARNAPDLRVSRSYSEMFDAYDKGAKKRQEAKRSGYVCKAKIGCG